jgi:apolipoprotein N-acyltransferase
VEIAWSVAKFLTVFMGGLMMGLAMAPTAAFYLAWLALVPLWLFILNTQKRPFPAQLRQTAIAAILWGVGYYGLSLFWITGIHPMTWMGVPWLASLAIALGCWFLITLFGVCLVLFWALGLVLWDSWPQQFKAKRQTKFGEALTIIARLLWGITLWCGLEALGSAGPLWWNSLAASQSPHNLLILQWGQFSGFSTVTAAIALVNGLIAEIIFFCRYHQITPRQLGLVSSFPVSIFLSLHFFGFWLYQQPLGDDPQQAIKVGIIQGNIPNEIKLYPQGLQRAIAGYTEGYQKLAQMEAEVVLTPEGALPYFWEDIVKSSAFYQAILQTKIPVWLGAYGTKDDAYTNSLFAVTGAGKLSGRYDKVKLVPLGEYIPLSSLLGKIINRLSPLKGELTAGNPQQIFQTSFGQAIVSICYESAFPERLRDQARRGGEFILSSANNAHYSPTMPAQHHALDVMRAIESDRWVARATNTGYSAIISPRGKTLWLSDLNHYQLHLDTIYRRRTQTLYVAYGDRLTPLLAILSLIVWIIRTGLFYSQRF